MQDLDRNRTDSPVGTEYVLDTAAFAARNGVKSQTVRVRICKFGHYFGVRPRKLANGRLLFPAVQVVAE